MEQVTAEGERVIGTFDGRFRNLDQARTDEIMRMIIARGKEAEQGEPPADGLNDQTLAEEVLDGWRHMVGADGAELPFSEERKARFLQIRGGAAAIVSAWFESITTKPEVREGNS